MSIISFNWAIKIYSVNLATRSNIVVMRDGVLPVGTPSYNHITFPFNSNYRLVSLSGQVQTLPPGTQPPGIPNTVPDTTNQPVNIDWFARLIPLNFDGSRISAGEVVEDSSTFTVFAIGDDSLYLSSKAPVFRPECMYVGGMDFEMIAVFFNASYTVTNPYWGRLFLRAELEIL